MFILFISTHKDTKKALILNKEKRQATLTFVITRVDIKKTLFEAKFNLHLRRVSISYMLLNYHT